MVDIAASCLRASEGTEERKPIVVDGGCGKEKGSDGCYSTAKEAPQRAHDIVAFYRDARLGLIKTVDYPWYLVIGITVIRIETYD